MSHFLILRSGIVDNFHHQHQQSSKPSVSAICGANLTFIRPNFYPVPVPVCLAGAVLKSRTRITAITVVQLLLLLGLLRSSLVLPMDTGMFILPLNCEDFKLIFRANIVRSMGLTTLARLP